MEVLTLESKLRPYGLVLTHHVWQHLTRRPFPRLKNCALPSNCVTQPRHCPPFTRLTQRSMTQLPSTAFSRSISGKYDPSCKQPGGQTMAMGEALRSAKRSRTGALDRHFPGHSLTCTIGRSCSRWQTLMADSLLSCHAFASSLSTPTQIQSWARSTQST